MTDTRGPAPGKVPPHVKERLEEKRRKAQLREQRGPVWKRPPALTAAAVVLLLVGVAIGYALAGDPLQSAADEVAEEVVPLVNESEALMRVGIGGSGSIAQAAQALETSNDTTAIEDNVEAWTTEHQRLLDELDAVEVDVAAQPLKDLFRGAIRAQLDAVGLLGAAVAHEGSARAELLRAALREIARSRTLLQDAREALAAMGGPEAPAVQIPTVPGLTRPGAPLPSPLAEAPAPDGSPAPADDPSPSASPSAAPSEPEPTASPS